MSFEKPVPIPVLTGPTASGKTAISLEIAERIGAEIISADSRQVYRELTIGTAKPTPYELSRVPHHFINELSLEEPFSAGAFAARANHRIREIISRGRTPLIVGGSTLYLHALQFGLAPVPPTNTESRKYLEKRLDADGAAVLYDELQRVDPAVAETLDATKTSRLIRALEVYHTTGKPLSAFHAEQEPPPFQFEVTVLDIDRELLYQRINGRVDIMLNNGLIAEVESILEAGYDPKLQALHTIGYREPIEFLRGEISRAEMTRLIKRNSRRYAKRQLTWLRRYPDYHWVDTKYAIGVFLGSRQN